ncbi:MAG: hypothetical protein MUE30_07770 [Spirosomaceae bacterium]|jgi:hypothetical protein|nr:hypothetical protein [Spirosomataceae bacterium]
MKKIGLILVFSILTMGVSVAQCAMCKGAVQTNMSTGRNVIGNGINEGIAYLFAFPYLIVGIIGYLWYRTSKKNLEQRLAVQARVREAMK